MNRKVEKRKKRFWAFCLVFVLMMGNVIPMFATAAEYNFQTLSNGNIVHAGDEIYIKDYDCPVTYIISGREITEVASADNYYVVKADPFSPGDSNVGKAWKITEIDTSGGSYKLVLSEYKASYGANDKSCNHNLEYTTIREATETEDGIRGLQCSTCGWIDESSLEYLTSYQFFNWLCEKKIREAEGTELTINTNVWFSFNKSVMEALSEKPNLNLTINYTYQHKKYTVTIPAGTDVMTLLNEDGYCGFRYLDQQFGGKEVQ